MYKLNFLALLALCRPVQWLKNLMLLFPPFFAGTLFKTGTIRGVLCPLLAFSLASSSSYVINDLFDTENDRLHPTKKKRPLASDSITVKAAWLLAVLIMVIAVGLALSVSQNFLVYLLVYWSIVVAYSITLKEQPIVDIFCISSGFVLRLLAGGEVFSVNVSEWLSLSVFLLALFLSTGKRLSEKIQLGDGAHSHRKSLASYPDGLLDGIMFLTGGAVLVTYTQYIISRHILLYTVPLCCFGLLRYIYLVKSGSFGDPTEALVKDRQMVLVGGAWAGIVAWVIYA